MGFFDKFRVSDSSSSNVDVEGSTPSFVGTDIGPASELNFLPQRDFPGESYPVSLASPSGSDEPRLYNPYDGLNTAVDPRVLRNVYKLPQQPEFLFSEQATIHSRSWSENLQYYTGTGYLAGALLGGGRGAVQALRTPLDITARSNRLRLNRLLNNSGTSGRTAGNALGVLGLLYACSDSGLGYLSDGRTPDAVNSLAAGFLTGAVFRSTRGPRAAVVAGAVGAVTAALLLGARNMMPQKL